MDLMYTTHDIDTFLSSIYFNDMVDNDGGMKPNDMFSLYFLLNKLRPTLVIESGVWNGKSTKLIRKTLGPDAIIVCLDPRNIPVDGYRDDNKNTHYFIDSSFVDFGDLDLQKLNLGHISPNNILCFFDDHQNSAQRLSQCISKGMYHLFFNDNYPVGAGSHYSIQHLIDNDTRDKFQLDRQYPYSINTLPHIDMNRRDSLIHAIKTYVVFPNVFSSDIVLYEGTFRSQGFFKDTDTEAIRKYSLFHTTKQDYCWNTYLTITNTPTLSLCIPTMDRWEFLKVNIPNYLANPYISEIIISDENGNDAAHIRATFNSPKLRISVNATRLGPFLNKNKVVSLASNAFICLMDSDNFAPVSYFEAWEKWLNGNIPNENTIYSPSRTIPQPNHTGFDYRCFNGVFITQKNYKYYWKNVHIAGCLYNTGNYIVSKNMYMNTNTDPHLKHLEYQKSPDVMFKNYFMWKNNNMQMVIVPGMEYAHIVHDNSYYIQELSMLDVSKFNALYE